MNEVTKKVLQDWSITLSNVANDLVSRSSVVTPLKRQEAAASTALKAFTKKEAALNGLRTYLETADALLEQEESRLNGS